MRNWVGAALLLALVSGTGAAQTFGKARAKTGPTGTRRAVVIGISNYDSIPQLRFADRDARAFAAFLLSPKGFVDSANLHLLINEQATSWRIRRELSWLKQQSRPGDEAIIYFAGHGDVDDASEHSFLLAYNAREERYYEGGLQTETMEEFLVGIANKGQISVLLITDACRSGNLAGGAAGRVRTTNALVMPWLGVSKLVSSGPDGPSQEGAEWGDGHGIFTYYLIAALNGRGDQNGDGVVTGEELWRFVDDSVTGPRPRGVGKSQVPWRAGNMAWDIAWVNSAPASAATASNGTRSPARSAAPPSPDDSVVQIALARFQQAVAAGILFDSGGAYQIYTDALASTTAADEARSTLIAELEQQAYKVMTDYLNDGTTSGDARRAGTALQLAGDLAGEKSMRARKLLARRLFFEGYAYGYKRDVASALSTLARSIALEPEPAWAYNARGFVFLSDLQLDSAWIAFSAARERVPRHGYPLLGLGLVALQLNDGARALALIDTAATRSGPQVAVQVARAVTLLELDRRTEAAAVFRAAMTMDPGLTHAAYVPEALRDMPKAVARLERLRALVR